MWGGKKSPFGVSGATTLISRDTVVVGDLHFTGNLDVEGLVQGSIIAGDGDDALVRVLDKGCVEGQIRAPCVLINGEVKGDVHASRHLELAARGRVQGNVFYTLLEMAAGSEVNGSLTHVVDGGGPDADAKPDTSRGEKLAAGRKASRAAQVMPNKVD